jgi:hypothetical protein
MVMVKFSDPAVDIEGKVSGVYYRHDQCINHIQAMPRVVDRFEKSPQNKAFTRAKNAWSSHQWTQSEIDKWWIWCYDHPKKNKKGETVYLHPFLAFLSVNTKRILTGKEIVITPPS